MQMEICKLSGRKAAWIQEGIFYVQWITCPSLVLWTKFYTQLKQRYFYVHGLRPYNYNCFGLFNK